jgi:hypothetical protein
MDAAVMSVIRRQRSPSQASCAGLHRQFPSHTRDAGAIKDWSLTSLKEKLIKIGAKVVSHGRYVAFQMAEVAIPKALFADILRMIAELRPPHVASTAYVVRMCRVRSNSQERCASMTEIRRFLTPHRPPTRSNVIDFLPRRFRLVAAGGMAQCFRPTGGPLGNVG